MRIWRWLRSLFRREKPVSVEKPVLNEGVKTFNYQYNGDFFPRKRDYQFLDLWNYSKEDVELAKKYTAEQCGYMSCHYEKWRDDAHEFKSHWLLKKLDNWDGEMIINPEYLEQVLPIMEKRIEELKAKGFTAVEFDNTDAWYWFVDKKLRDKSIEYYNRLFYIAKKHGLKCGLKNSAFMFPDVQPDFIICEEAFEWNAIEQYLQFGVPVFNIEYKRKHYEQALKDPRLFTIMKDKYEMGSEEL